MAATSTLPEAAGSRFAMAGGWAGLRSVSGQQGSDDLAHCSHLGCNPIKFVTDGDGVFTLYDDSKHMTFSSTGRNWHSTRRTIVGRASVDPDRRRGGFRDSHRRCQ